MFVCLLFVVVVVVVVVVAVLLLLSCLHSATATCLHRNVKLSSDDAG